MSEPTYLNHSEIRAQIEATCAKLGMPELAARIAFKFNEKFTRKLGVAKLRTNQIEFSTRLFQAVSPAERRDTVIHEVCHLVAQAKYGRVQAHGKEWKHLMLLAGGRPKACAERVNREEVFAPGTRVKAYCNCTIPFMLTHKRAKIVDRLTCRKCKAKLALSPPAPKPVVAPVVVKPASPALVNELETLREIIRLRKENEALRQQIAKRDAAKRASAA